MRRFAIGLVALLGFAPWAAAQDVIVGLSTEEVAITSNFDGAELTVFGAVDLDDGDTADLIILLRGPDGAVTARRKERILGLWINRTEASFAAVPSFYALHATAPLSEIASPEDVAERELGIATIVRASRRVEAPFAEALVRLRTEDGHYSETVGSIERPGANLFRTDFILPADIPVGRYFAEVYVFRDGVPIADQTVAMDVVKTGGEQFIFDFSRNYPWLYALVIVVFAVTIGWLSGVIFRRD